MSSIEKLQSIKNNLEHVKEFHFGGRVSSVKGILIEAVGLANIAPIGTKCYIKNGKEEILCEVLGFENEKAYLMPFGEIEGIKVNSEVVVDSIKNEFFPCDGWMGRVIDGLGKPIDEKGPLPLGEKSYVLQNPSPPPQQRNRVAGKIDLGVRAIDSFITCCYGQRMGIFAGSGVGKSVLISMLTRYAKTDVKVIGLIGERGREVKEFIEEYLGEEGLKTAVIIVATGDKPALLRKQAAYLTMTVAEYFRDQGKEVMCIIDSLTRFAMAQREIGLSVGEPPSTKGYTPSVFSELPKLLERAGPGVGKGNITGLFTVLVEGDDQNEPISDTVRGILDGHIVLDRAIAERGRFPAINILKSISRTMPGCNNDKENRLVVYARKVMSTYNDMAEMIRLGAYKKGSDPEVDFAINAHPQLESFLTQSPKDSTPMRQSYELLAQILNLKDFYSENKNNTQS